MKTLLFPLLRGISILLAFLTGMTALVFQNIWHRYLTYLLGSQSQATAIILAVFLGGMAVGYFLYGHLSRIFQDKLFKLYGATEFLIGVWAFFSPQVYRLLAQTPIEHFLAEIGVAILFLGIPTILMGGTIPILTQALSANLQSATRTHSLIYSFNTFGAAGGSLLAGFYMLPRLGLPISLLYAGTINVAAAVFFYLSNDLFSREKNHLRTTDETPKLETPRLSSTRWLWLIAFISGFVTIGLEAIMIRLMGMSAGSSVYSFSVIVAIFVFCIGLGGFLVGRLKEIPTYAIWLLQTSTGIALLGLYSTIETWPYFTHIIRTFFTSNAQTFPVYYGVLTLALSLILIIPISLCGATLPLCFHFVKNRTKDLGSETGKLYAINTAGCVLGALLPGYYLLYRLNLNEVFIFLLYLIVLSSGIALVQVWQTLGRTRQLIFAPLSICLFTALAGQPLWDNQSFAFGLFRIQTLNPQSFKGYRAMRFKYDHLFYRDGPTASTSVLPNKYTDTKATGLSIQVNGKTDGNTHTDFNTMQLLGHLPVLFAQSPERVCVIGFGTGMTAGVVTQYKEVKKVDLIEINPMVLEAGKLFASVNYNVQKNPKTHVYMTDAIRFLRTADNPYDVIISEPSNPWMAGVGNLFSRDFYELAIKHLAEHGVFMQWFHGYSLSDDTLKLVLNTFRSVFPHYYIFILQESDYAILGTKQPLSHAVMAQIQEKLAKEKDNQALGNLGMGSAEQFLALEILSEKSIDAYAEGGGLHTLENPKLDYWAGLDFFTNASIQAEEIEDGLPLESRSPSLLTQWENFSGEHYKINFPETFCRFNAGLCNKYKTRNEFVARLSAKTSDGISKHD